MATSSMIGPILEGELISYLYSLLSHSYSYWRVSSYSYLIVSFDAGNAHYGDDGEGDKYEDGINNQQWSKRG